MLRFAFLPSDFNPMLLLLGEADDLRALAATLRGVAQGGAEIALETLPFCAAANRTSLVLAIGDSGLRRLHGHAFAWRLAPARALGCAELIDALADPGRPAGSELLEEGAIAVKVSRGEYTDDFLVQLRSPAMTDISAAGSFRLGDRAVNRMGYGAMQLAGPGVFGPPRDREAALAVLREAVASGVDHIDTSDFYGPHITNQLIREALHPYPDRLVIVTKIGAVRGADASWNPATAPAELVRAVHDNLRNLGLDVLDIVNFRVMGEGHGMGEGSIEEPFTTLAELRRQGLIRHLGISNATAAQVAQARAIAGIACVQNLYNLAHRADDALIDELAGTGIAYVPFFPLGGFTPLQSSVLSDVAAELGATPMQVALAWLLHRAPHILLIPGTSSVDHLRENLLAAELRLSDEALRRLDTIAPPLPVGEVGE